MDYPSSFEEIRRIADEAMRPVVGGFESVALVGFPDHSNVGDSAIWLGELAYLKSESVKVAYSCSSESYRKENLERHTDVDTPILIHGGGYFGDTWQEPFGFMLRMVEDFPDRSIIVMPQTIHFQSSSQLERARRVINGHHAMTICVRDHRSAQLAQEYFEHQIVLSPDSAMFLDLGTASGGRGVLYLARDDREASAAPSRSPGMGVERRDWANSRVPILAARVFRAAGYRAKAGLCSRLGRRSTAGWQEEAASLAQNSISRLRVHRGARLLASTEVVVTDRLHAHILSTLLGIPNILLDNSYGKVRAYYETWCRGLSSVHWASNADEALAMAENLTREVL